MICFWRTRLPVFSRFGAFFLLNGIIVPKTEKNAPNQKKKKK